MLKHQAHRPFPKLRGISFLCVHRSILPTNRLSGKAGAVHDIFDALNTTGEPLTALETLWPKVIEFENSLDGYRGSESYIYLDNIKSHLDNVFVETDKRQKATKELLVSFALYLEGYKLSLHLNSQRTYLRTRFNKLSSREGANLKRRFIGAISQVAEFRHCYWHADEIEKLNSKHPSFADVELLKLCFEFIRGMNTSLAIPVLARYWVRYQENSDVESFFGAVGSLTAFVVLRRAVTGNTGGIDSEFRHLMQKPPSVGGDPLCAGPEHTNELIDVDDFKKELSIYLSNIGITGKSDWVNKAREIPLANFSRPLCRFLILAAAHNARPDPGNPGLMSRQGIRVAPEINFLDFKIWQNEKYMTVEHIAPESDPGSGWSPKIYQQPSTRHTLGNLILLPKNENSAIGNAGWQKKKIFYSALTADTDEEAKQSLQRAKDKGYAFKRRTEDMILSGEMLHLLAPLTKVDEWSEELIKNRTENILQLAWDEISPWLYNKAKE